MQHNAELLKADIEDELKKLALLNNELELVTDKLELDNHQVSF